MTQSQEEIFNTVATLVGNFNTRGIEINKETKFTADLDLDSLAVMDLLAEIEDHFDITVHLNILPDLENVGQVADAVAKIVNE